MDGYQGRGDHRYHRDRARRQRFGDREREKAPEAARADQSLRGQSGGCRFPRRGLRHVFQRVRRAERSMDVRQDHVRRVVLVGRVFLHSLDPASLLHQRGQVLRDCQAVGVPRDHEEAHCHLYAGQCVATASFHQFHSHFHGVVRHGRASGTVGQ